MESRSNSAWHKDAMGNSGTVCVFKDEVVGLTSASDVRVCDRHAQNPLIVVGVRLPDRRNDSVKNGNQSPCSPDFTSTRGERVRIHKLTCVTCRHPRRVDSLKEGYVNFREH